jgi:DNA primase
VSISPEKIEAIRRAVNIADVVGDEVQLRKQGQRLVGLCPFHGEKTPSFSVSPDKGLYYCFGCHAGGDVFAYVMRREGLEFHEFIR